MFPQSFIDDVRLQTDLVQVVQEYVTLKRAGSSFKGLCPFHAEKTPSFHVNREKGFFHCFGCGVGGDVFKFLELKEQLGFQEAMRHLAERCGLTLPESEPGDQAQNVAEREALLDLHQRAAEFFQQLLQSPAGARARQQLGARGLSDDLTRALGLGFAPSAAGALKAQLLERGGSLPMLLRSGLIVERERGEPIDRFRGRLMVPICRENGAVIAFGGRAMDEGQQPKYLNSPETPIYSKSRTLYGVHLTKAAIRRLGYAILVEGYFDFAQVFALGLPVVASCGTALTAAQGQLLRRFASKVVLSFDPDAAGQEAAARSCELLVGQGFDVNVAMMPAGADPDTFVRARGGAAYGETLRNSKPYLEYLLDRTAQEHDFTTDEGRRQFLTKMLAVAARIPDAAARDQFADRLAHKARVTEEVVRAEIRRAAAAKRATLSSRELPGFGTLKPAEKGLIWAIVHDPQVAGDALAGLDDADLDLLASRQVLAVARSLHRQESAALPSGILQRLSTMDAQLVTEVAAATLPPAPPADCVRALKRLRYERERAAVQREIDRLQALGASEYDREIDELWARKKDLLHHIEALTS